MAFLVTLCIALTLAAECTSSPQAQAQEWAGSKDPYDFGDCRFKKGNSEVDEWANQICWLDLTGLEKTSDGQGKTGRVTKKFGDYTMTFWVGIYTENGGNLFPVASPVWKEGSTFGAKGYFESHLTGFKDALQLTNGNGAKSAKVILGDIKIADRYGEVSDFNLLLADAESTGAGGIGEMISIENLALGQDGTPDTSGAQVKKLGRFKAGGVNNACSDHYGPLKESLNSHWKKVGNEPRDFVCHSKKNDKHGSFLVRTDFRKDAKYPKAEYNNDGSLLYRGDMLEFGMGTRDGGEQAIAIGINLGRISFPKKGEAATVDSNYENALVGTTTIAGYEAFIRKNNGNEFPILGEDGATVPVFRSTNPGVKLEPSDKYVFRSQLSSEAPVSMSKEGNARASDLPSGFERYDPEWTCSLWNSRTPTLQHSPWYGDRHSREIVTIREGDTHELLSIKNNPQSDTSEIEVTDPKNRRAECAVKWVPRFVGTQLELTKTVDGSAANHSEIVNRRFRIKYTCNDIQGTGNHPANPTPAMFSTAYGESYLSGEVELKHGEATVVPNLPWGASCALEEVYDSAAVPPGISLDLKWNEEPDPDPANANNGDIGYRVTLVEGNNQAHARSRYDYDYRFGVLELTPAVFGKPVDEGKTFENQPVEIVCSEGEESTTRIDAKIGETTPISGIPVGQKCAVNLLQELQGEQIYQMAVDSREVTLHGDTVQALEGSNAYPFILVEEQAVDGHLVTEKMEINTKYSYRDTTSTLPATGRQSLVWLLVVGLLVFGYGAFRYLLRDPEDDVEAGENVETH